MNRTIMAEELAKFEDQEGRIDPKAVIEAARDRTHPLHNSFNWDDKECGDIVRLQQCRMYIRMVKAEYREEDHVVARTVKYVHDPLALPRQSSYKRVSVIKNGPSKADIFVNECDQVLGRFRRLRDIAVALGLAGHVQGLMDQLIALSEAVRVQRPRKVADEPESLSS